MTAGWSPKQRGGVIRLFSRTTARSRKKPSISLTRKALAERAKISRLRTSVDTRKSQLAAKRKATVNFAVQKRAVVRKTAIKTVKARPVKQVVRQKAVTRRALPTRETFSQRVATKLQDVAAKVRQAKDQRQVRQAADMISRASVSRIAVVARKGERFNSMIAAREGVVAPSVRTVSIHDLTAGGNKGLNARHGEAGSGPRAKDIAGRVLPSLDTGGLRGDLARINGDRGRQVSSALNPLGRLRNEVAGSRDGLLRRGGEAEGKVREAGAGRTATDAQRRPLIDSQNRALGELGGLGDRRDIKNRDAGAAARDGVTHDTVRGDAFRNRENAGGRRGVAEGARRQADNSAKEFGRQESIAGAELVRANAELGGAQANRRAQIEGIVTRGEAGVVKTRGDLDGAGSSKAALDANKTAATAARNGKEGDAAANRNEITTSGEPRELAARQDVSDAQRAHGEARAETGRLNGELAGHIGQVPGLEGRSRRALQDAEGVRPTHPESAASSNRANIHNTLLPNNGAKRSGAEGEMTRLAGERTIAEGGRVDREIGVRNADTADRNGRRSGLNGRRGGAQANKGIYSGFSERFGSKLSDQRGDNYRKGLTRDGINSYLRERTIASDQGIKHENPNTVNGEVGANRSGMSAALRGNGSGTVRMRFGMKGAKNREGGLRQSIRGLEGDSAALKTEGNRLRGINEPTKGRKSRQRQGIDDGVGGRDANADAAKNAAIKAGDADANVKSTRRNIDDTLIPRRDALLADIRKLREKNPDDPSKPLRDAGDHDTARRASAADAEGARKSSETAGRERAEAARSANRHSLAEADARARREQAQRDFDAAKAERARALDGDVDRANRRVEEARAARDAAGKAERDLRKVRQESEAKREAARREADGIDEATRRKEGDTDSAEQARRKAKEESERATKQHDDMQKDLDKLLGDLDTLKEKARKAKQDADAKSPLRPAEREAAKARQKELEGLIRDKQKQIADARRRIELERALRDADSEELRRRIQEDEVLRKQREDLNEQRRKAKVERDTIRALADKLTADHARRQNHIDKVVGILAIIGGLLGLLWLLTRRPPPPPAPPAEAGPSSAAPTISERPSGADRETPPPTERPSGAAPAPLPLPIFMDLACKIGSADYVRGCNDGKAKGKGDGNSDGTKDQIAHAAKIIPYTNREIEVFVDINIEAFSPIQKEAYCTEVERDGVEAGLNMETIKEMYPQCYGLPPTEPPGPPEPLELSELSDNYGDGYGYGRGYGYGYGYGYGDGYGYGYGYGEEPSTSKQRGGAGMDSIVSQSADYVKGYAEGYETAYKMAYQTAWAISKVNSYRAAVSRTTPRGGGQIIPILDEYLDNNSYSRTISNRKKMHHMQIVMQKIDKYPMKYKDQLNEITGKTIAA
jgi:hypothetical protein